MSDQDNNTEQSFNDAELQDIMNEIENLEKEFVEESDTPQDAATESVSEAPAETEEVHASQEAPQEVAEEEVEDFSAEAEAYESEPTPTEPEATESNEDNVVALKPVATTSGEAGHMSFSGGGQMNMELNFSIGSETATVNVVDGSLVVEMAGVHLSLTEEGCEVSMAGGVKFSVPVQSKDAGKKAA